MCVHDLVKTYYGGNPIKVHEQKKEKVYYHPLDVLRDYGHFTVQRWTIIDGCICIEII